MERVRDPLLPGQQTLALPLDEMFTFHRTLTFSVCSFHPYVVLVWIMADILSPFAQYVHFVRSACQLSYTVFALADHRRAGRVHRGRVQRRAQKA